jgi:hypothetical protein
MLANTVCQTQRCRLIHRIREQARSHRFYWGEHIFCPHHRSFAGGSLFAIAVNQTQRCHLMYRNREQAHSYRGCV